MDNLTHTLFAVTLGRTPLGRAGRGATATLVLASNAPDVDVLMAARRGGLDYLRWHRGPTHGPLGVVVLGALSALVVYGTLRHRDRGGPSDEASPPASLAMLVAVSMIGALLHILMDLPTSYGTRLLSPFDWHWFAVDWMPIVDVYLLIILAAGLLFGRVSPAARRRNAALVLVLMAANYGLRAVAHHQALAVAGRVYGPLMPKPCDSDATVQSGIDRWPRESARASAVGRQRCLVELAAMPTFFSPFEWRLVAQLSNAYEVHEVNLLESRLQREPEPGEAPWRLTVRYPNQWTPRVAAAAATDLGQVFLGFSRFPDARWVVNDRTGDTIVRWTDMRFTSGPTVSDQPMRGTLFGAVVRFDRDGRIVEQRLGR